MVSQVLNCILYLYEIHTGTQVPVVCVLCTWYWTVLRIVCIIHTYIVGYKLQYSSFLRSLCLFYNTTGTGVVLFCSVTYCILLYEISCA